MNYPKLRAVSAFPITHENERFICLQDQHHYLETPVMLSPETFGVIRFFDGKHSLTDIQDAYLRCYGMRISTEQLQMLVEQLEQCFLLDSPAFAAHVERLRREFAQLPLRKPAHQGLAYPADKDALCRQFDCYFTMPDGPGPIPRQAPSSSNQSVNAIMAPHIDFSAGGPTYAWAYRTLAASDAELFIILGTSHVETKNFFALTAKTFETPFGQMRAHIPFIRELCAALPYDPFEDELIHKHEHSVEFQVVFLHYLRERLKSVTRPISIVPLICGGELHEAIADQRPLEEVPQLEASIRALQEVMARYDKICLIAGVDLSHVGLRYGHEHAPDAAQLNHVKQVDYRLLNALENGSHREFFELLQHNRNATQVCGVVPLYTLLRLLDGKSGNLLHYQQAEFGEGSYVSFAGMVWKNA